MGRPNLGLIGIVLAGYAVYLFIVYVLPWIVVIAVGLGLPGYGLTQLLTSQRFQLSSRSAVALFFVVGFTAWVTSMAVVSSTGMNPWFALLIAPSCFYTQGLILLCVWALYRLAKGWKQLYHVRRQLQHSEAVVAGLQRGVRMARLEVERIDQEHGEQMKKVANIREQINGLCAREPRSLGLLVCKERASVSSMSGADIRNKLNTAVVSDQGLGHRVRALLFQQELIERNVDGPLREMDRARKNLRDTQRKLETAQRTADQLKEKKEQCQEMCNRGRSGTILL